MATQNNYVLGKGRVFFDRFGPGTKISERGERFLGNCPDISTTSSTDTLDHYASTGGIRVKDASVDLQTDRTGAFTCDNISLPNLALFFTGEAGEVAQSAATAAVETKVLYRDTYLQLGMTDSNPSGVRSVSNLVISTGGDPGTPLAATNYTLDAERGRVYIHDDAADVTDDGVTEYTLTYDAAATTRNQVISKNQSIYGAIRFVADNPTGDNHDYYFPYVKLSPSGDFNLIGDDWQVLGFDMEILKLSDNVESLYIDGVASLNG